MLLLGFAVGACRNRGSDSDLSSDQQAAVQTRIAYQQATNQAIIRQTQGITSPQDPTLEILFNFGTQDPDVTSTAVAATAGSPPTQTSQAATQAPYPTFPVVSTSDATASSTADTQNPTDPATTSMPTVTVTDMLTPTITPTDMLTPTVTPTYIVAPIDWTGRWTAFFGDEGGLLFRATLILTREGNTIIGEHSTQIFTGTLSPDGRSVSGTFVNPPQTGSFYWRVVDENQFCGNTEQAFAYCAARNGAVRPTPCRCFKPLE